MSRVIPEELFRAVVDALVQNGISPTSDDMHSWRCAYPETYGACHCFAETVDDIVTAVMREVS